MAHACACMSRATCTHALSLPHPPPTNPPFFQSFIHSHSLRQWLWTSDLLYYHSFSIRWSVLDNQAKLLVGLQLVLFWLLECLFWLHSSNVSMLKDLSFYCGEFYHSQRKWWPWLQKNKTQANKKYSWGNIAQVPRSLQIPLSILCLCVLHVLTNHILASLVALFSIHFTLFMLNKWLCHHEVIPGQRETLFSPAVLFYSS